MSFPVPVLLKHRHFGEKGRTPLVILHGLLGSSRNWQTVARDLVDDFSVYALDLRNHGESPHSSEMNYAALAADVCAWLDREGLGAVHLLGHSMGGKTAMVLATRYPERLTSLTVVDIAPKDYDSHHRLEFDAMNAMNIDGIHSRKEADDALEKLGVKDWAMRQFLLTNLVRNDTEGTDNSQASYRWLIDLPSLTKALPVLVKNPLANGACFQGPTFFIRGEKSDFIHDADIPSIHRYFPNAKILNLANSGHNPHIEDREHFAALLKTQIL
ncbi:MAG: alpha/beta fold hydrolase [Puniceicoccales bacterium]|jgi:pimeloyl-ACP methyl ester carboxylesterase|nr:alpha/beta fold hydrolase [Puniceicoccales bacterium]